MAKQPCAVCGKLVGLWSASSFTGDRQPICNRCASKSNLYFSTSEHALEEYYAHLRQMEDANRIFEALLKPRINFKQGSEGWASKRQIKKYHKDEKVKLYGTNLWAIEDYGLFFYHSYQHRQNLKRGEDGNRSLIFRFSDLLSYRYIVETVSASDDTSLHIIELTFNNSYLLNEIRVSVNNRGMYQVFDDYFKDIVNGDKKQWDMLADQALAKV